MIDVKKIWAILGTTGFGIFIILVYLFKHTVPLTDIYLGTERISHVLVVFISGLLGTMLLLILKNAKIMKGIRIAGSGFSFLLIVCVPILLFFSQSRSFRGSEWALTTLIIGLIPILFIYASFLVYSGNRIVNLFLALIFTVFSIYHLLLLIRIFPRLGKAFSTSGISDLLTGLSLVLLGGLCAIFSIRQYLSFRK